MKKVCWFYDDNYETYTVYFDLPKPLKCEYIVCGGDDSVTDRDLLDDSEKQQEFGRLVRKLISFAEEHSTWENCDEDDWDNIASLYQDLLIR